MSEEPAAPEYVLGRSERESQRLVKQSIFLRPSTERVFRKAGITAECGCWTSGAAPAMSASWRRRLGWADGERRRRGPRSGRARSGATARE